MKLGSRSRGDSQNQRAAKKRQAEARRCPKCGRGAALAFMSDALQYGSYCRYSDCGYERITIRDNPPVASPDALDNPEVVDA